MKYFIITSSPAPGVSDDQATDEAIITAHLQHIQRGFDEGWILFSGPKAQTSGGVLIMKAESESAVEAFFATDPLQVAGILKNEWVEFKLHDCQDAIKHWFA